MSGDSEAFAEIVRRHRDRLWAVAVRTLGDREDAADAVQDALVKAFRAAGTFRGEAQVTTWLHRIVVNTCLDQARRRAARPTVPLTDTAQGAGGGAAALAGPDVIGLAERSSEVGAALAALPAEQAAALTLVDVLGFGVEEAARILDVPTGTVKSRCARGRARLAVRLGHLAPDRPAPDRNHGAAAAVPPVEAAPTEERSPGTAPAAAEPPGTPAGDAPPPSTTAGDEEVAPS